MYRYELALNINYLIMAYKIGIIDMKWIAIHKPSIANYDQGIQKENSKEWKPSCISLYSTWESKKKKPNHWWISCNLQASSVLQYRRATNISMVLMFKIPHFAFDEESSDRPSPPGFSNDHW